MPRPAEESRLGTGLSLTYFSGVSFYVRLIGTTNAAVWLGAAVCFLVGVWPAFSSSEMLQILPSLHAEGASYVALSRFFALQNWCALIAVLHLSFETVYAGRSVRRWLIYVVVGLFLLGLALGTSVGPRLKHLHLERYGTRSTPQQRQQAESGLQLWRGVVLVSEILVVIGCWVYVVEMNAAGTSARLIGASKFRG